GALPREHCRLKSLKDADDFVPGETLFEIFLALDPGHSVPFPPAVYYSLKPFRSLASDSRFGGGGAEERNALAAFKEGAVRQQARVASRAGVCAGFHHAFGPDVVAGLRVEALQLAVARGLAAARRRRRRGHCREKCCVHFKDELARADPVGLGVEFGRIEDNLRLLLLQRVKIPCGLSAGEVHRIRAVDGPDLKRVILGGGHVLGRAIALRKGNFHGGDGLVVPRLGNMRMKRRVAGAMRRERKDGEGGHGNSASHIGSFQKTRGWNKVARIRGTILSPRLTRGSRDSRNDPIT